MAAKHDLTIELGATFHRRFRLSDKSSAPKNLSAYTTAKMDIRKRDTTSTLVMSLTNANGRIVLTEAASGVIELLVDPATLAAITWPDSLEYDLFIVKPDGYSVKLLRGAVKVERKVTTV